MGFLIVDSHTHIWERDWLPEAFWRGFSSVIKHLIPGMTEEEVMRNVMPVFWHSPPEELLAEMDEAGIEKAVILPLDWGLRLGEPKLSVEELNRRFAEIGKQYPDRFLPFVGVDPRRKNAVELLERGLGEWGMAGLKLHPTSGFYPNDPICYPLYRKCEEYGVPVLIHTGTELPPLLSRFARPVYADDVAADFPDLKIILAHLGFGWWEEAMSVAMMKPNVYLDTAAWGNYCTLHFYRILRTLCDVLGSERILFGSDWPITPKPLLSEAGWVEKFRNPPEEVRAAGICFSQGEVENILGKNAARVLEL